MDVLWNLWRGCHRFSEGCTNCYVYRGDAKYGRDTTDIHKTEKFDLPIKKKKDGTYKYPSGTTFFTCFTSDFLLQDADEWRNDAWKMIKERSDCYFFFITKRIERFMDCIPPDWGDGYDNLGIGCTVENQELADFRLDIFNKAPIKHRTIICEPLLEAIDLSKHINSNIEEVVAGGESGLEARDCDFKWIQDIQEICVKNDVKFWFKQTGTYFIKDGVRYTVKRMFQHQQAKKANLNFKK